MILLAFGVLIFVGIVMFLSSNAMVQDVDTTDMDEFKAFQKAMRKGKSQ